MPKDLGLEWTINQEAEINSAWDVDVNGEYFGISSLNLVLTGDEAIVGAVPEMKGLTQIWPEDKYQISLDSHDNNHVVRTTSKTDPNLQFEFSYDASNRVLSFVNDNPLLDDMTTGYNPTQDNLEALIRLGQFGELLGLPRIDDKTINNINKRIVDCNSIEQAEIQKYLEVGWRRQEDIERLRKKSKEIYESSLLPLLAEANAELATTTLDPEIFTNKEIRERILSHSSQNVIGDIAAILHLDEGYFENQNNAQAFKEYVRKATFAHDYLDTAKYGAKQRGKHDDFIEVLNVNATDTLSATIVAPHTRKFQLFGAGHDKTRPTYLLPITEFVGRSVAFRGDIDDPDMELYYRSPEDPDKYFQNIYTIQDATIVQALRDQIWGNKYGGRNPDSPRYDYNEVIIFSKIDWSKYPLIDKNTVTIPS